MKLRMLFLSFILALIGPSNALAKDCAKARVLSGKSCSSLKVQFNLRKCGEAKSIVFASVNCKKKPYATFASEKATYKVKLQQDEWSEEWKTCSLLIYKSM